MSEAEIKYWEGEITNAEIDQLADAGGFYLEVEEIFMSDILIRALRGESKRIKTSRRPVLRGPMQPSNYPFFSDYAYRLSDL